MNKYVDTHGLEYFANKMNELFGTKSYNIKDMIWKHPDFSEYQNGDLFRDRLSVYMKIVNELRKLTNDDGVLYADSLQKAFIDFKKTLEEYDSSQWLALLED